MSPIRGSPSRSLAHSPASDFGHPISPTNQPAQKSLSLAERQAEKERRFHEDFVIKTAAERDSEYTRIFSGLGLGVEESERFKSNRVELHRKAIEAGEPLMALMKARKEYDSEIRAALGEENYRQYRDYEESKPAVREYEMLRDYALNTKNLAIDPAYSGKIIQLVREAGAATTETWDGPYDPLPHPTLGLEMSTNEMNQQILVLSESSSVLLERARQAAIPNEYTQLLTDYYAKKLDEMEKQRAFFSRPEEEVMGDLRRQQEERVAQLKAKIRAEAQARSEKAP